jgi:hypothetical protein
MISANYTVNQFNSTTENEYFDIREVIYISGIIYCVYLVGLAFILMLLFSILLVHTILKSRLRILRFTNQRDRNRLKKDIQFAISSIFMNFFYLLVYLPACIYRILKSDHFVFKTDLFNIFHSIAFMHFCDHFYILFCCNTMFRREVLVRFRLKSRVYKINTR